MLLALFTGSESRPLVPGVLSTLELGFAATPVPQLDRLHVGRRPLRWRELPDGQLAAWLPGGCRAVAEFRLEGQEIPAAPAPGGVPAVPAGVAGDAGVVDGCAVGGGGHARHCTRGRVARGRGGREAVIGERSGELM